MDTSSLAAIIYAIAAVVAAVAGYKKITEKKEETVAKSWQEYAKNQDKMNSDLREEVDALRKKINDREREFAKQLTEIIDEKNKTIHGLETRLLKYEPL